MSTRGKVKIQAQMGVEFSGINRVLRTLSKVESPTLAKVDYVWDHKGQLCVQWLRKPEEKDMKSFEDSWKSENELLLRYYLPDNSEISTQVGATVRNLESAEEVWSRNRAQIAQVMNK